MPASDSGERQRPENAPEHRQRAGSEAEGRLLEIAVDAFEHALQGQHHIGQVDGNDAQNDGRLGEHDLGRLAGDVEIHQHDAEKAAAPNSVIQPAARTALPTNSGNHDPMIRRFLKRVCVRAST